MGKREKDEMTNTHPDTYAFCDGCDEFLPTANLVVNDEDLLVCNMCK